MVARRKPVDAAERDARANLAADPERLLQVLEKASDFCGKFGKDVACNFIEESGVDREVLIVFAKERGRDIAWLDHNTVAVADACLAFADRCKRDLSTLFSNHAIPEKLSRAALVCPEDLRGKPASEIRRLSGISVGGVRALMKVLATKLGIGFDQESGALSDLAVQNPAAAAPETEKS